MPEAPPGSANERTALAWQRTSLSIMAGSVVLTRITLHRLGPAALLAVVVALPLGIWVLWESRGRYAHDAGIRGRRRSRGGRAPAALALGTIVLALVELLAIAAGR